MKNKKGSFSLIAWELVGAKAQATSSCRILLATGALKPEETILCPKGA